MEKWQSLAVNTGSVCTLITESFKKFSCKRYTASAAVCSLQLQWDFSWPKPPCLMLWPTGALVGPAGEPRGWWEIRPATHNLPSMAQRGGRCWSLFIPVLSDGLSADEKRAVRCYHEFTGQQSGLQPSYSMHKARSLLESPLHSSCRLWAGPGCRRPRVRGSGSSSTLQRSSLHQ